MSGAIEVQGPDDGQRDGAPPAQSLRRCLPPGCFPAERSRLLAAAVRRHAAPPVLRVLADLPADRVFTDLPALLRALRAAGPPAGRTTMDSRPAGRPGTERPVRVLLVEHDPAIRHLLAGGLRRAGYHLQLAATGQGGLLLAAPGIDLVLLGTALPDLDGPQVCRRLRALGHTVPVLLLGAGAGQVDPVVGIEAGASDYLAHPFHLAVLLDRIHTLVSAPTARVPQARPGHAPAPPRDKDLGRATAR